MASEVSKQDQALARAAGMVADAKRDLDTQLGQLRGKLEGIRSQWVGGGQVSFSQVMERWNGDAKKLIASLDEFEANLKQSEASYAAADDQQQQVFNRLSGRLG